MPMIYKFAKNCRVGDFVIPGGGEPMCHSYWKIVEITTDFVKYEAGGPKVVSDLNYVVIVRPDAPRHIDPDLFDEYYGPNGRYSPWPWGRKNKTSSELIAEVGEDMSYNVYNKWHAEARKHQRELARMERPELVIRTMHDRAVRDYYRDQDSVS